MEVFSFAPSLIVYDFDGVMTDNRVFVGADGTEYVTVNRGDGYAVRMIKTTLGIPQIILSTEANPVVLKRAEKLGIPAINNAGDSKSDILKRYLEETGIDPRKTLYIGNDLNDLGAMLLCGCRCCPSDAEPEIAAAAHHIFVARGGYGVIRELYRVLSEGNNGQTNS